MTLTQISKKMCKTTPLSTTHIKKRGSGEWFWASLWRFDQEWKTFWDEATFIFVAWWKSFALIKNWSGKVAPGQFLIFFSKSINFLFFKICFLKYNNFVKNRIEFLCLSCFDIDRFFPNYWHEMQFLTFPNLPAQHKHSKRLWRISLVKFQFNHIRHSNFQDFFCACFF